MRHISLIRIMAGGEVRTLLLLCITLLALAVGADDRLVFPGPIHGDTAAVRAPPATPVTGAAACECQCLELFFEASDAQGLVTRNGNCKSKYEGKLWCYVQRSCQQESSCPDVRPSTRFPGMMWSYQACFSKPRDLCYDDLRQQGQRVAPGIAIFGRFGGASEDDSTEKPTEQPLSADEP